MNDIELTEEQLEAKIKFDNMIKYRNLNIKPNHEARLKRILEKEDSDFTRELMKDNKMIDIIIECNSKPHLARLIYFYLQDCQDLKVGEVCHKFGISSSYYREIKAINKNKWQEEYLTKREEYFIDVVVEANDSSVSDAEYIERHGKDYDRNVWKV